MIVPVRDNPSKSSLIKYMVQRGEMQSTASFRSQQKSTSYSGDKILHSELTQNSMPSTGLPRQFIFSYDTLSNVGSVSFMSVLKVLSHSSYDSATATNPVHLSKTVNQDLPSSITALTDPASWHYDSLKRNESDRILDSLTGNALFAIQPQDDGRPKPILKVTKMPYGFKLQCNYTHTENGENITELITAFIGRPLVQYQALIYPVVPMGDKKRKTYEHWLPKGPKVDGSDDTKGNDSLSFYMVVRDKNDTTNIFHNYTVNWNLQEVSNYPGFCNNYPKYSESPNLEPDLKFHDTLRQEHEFASVSDVAANTALGEGEHAQVRIHCMDYAAWGKLSATVILEDGFVISAAAPYYDKQKTYITIPFDQDDNKLSDYWEDSMHILHAHHPLTWDEDNKPTDQKENGDGFTLFEEYRGFAVHKPKETAPDKADVYIRTNPLKKDAFIYDPEKLFQKYYESCNPSDLDWHYVSADKNQMYYDDNDIKRPLNRWVNFNKVGEYYYDEQYALVLKTSPGSCSYDPLTTGISFSADEWQYSLDFAARGETTPELLARLQKENDGTINLFSSPMKWHIKIVLYTNVIANKCSFIKTQNGEAAYLKAVDSCIEGTVRHEIGHCIGIRHHKPTADSGPETCLMRYWTNEQRHDVNVYMTPSTHYCKKAESGPDYIHTTRTGPTPPNEEDYAEHPAGTSSSDNCYGQITVKSKPEDN
jgi:hypothetical protein